jgi:NitT/TauT family transport system substrate-binding protein
MTFNRRQFVKYSLLALSTGIASACRREQVVAPPTTSPSAQPTSRKLDNVTITTSWFAQAEHGGIYQALATGIYQAHGLNVTIKMGGPQVNGSQLLLGGATDFSMGYGADAIQSIQQGLPKVTVAALFQKDPSVLIAHPGVGNDQLENLKGKPVLVSPAAYTTIWPFLVQKYGFTDDQKRPYNFNSAPFLADKTSAQQGIVTSEPYTIERQGGFKPVVFLLADHGYTPYAYTIDTTRKLVETNPDLVQRFVDATIKGWYSYFENPAPANDLIKKDNPQMTDDLIANGIKKMKEYGIVTSGNAEVLGIGAMSDDRWKSFFDDMVKAGIFKADTDYKKAYTLKFVNKGIAAYKAS